MDLDKIKTKVFNNSLQTCEYVSGYVNANSVITVHCLIHNINFETKYENVRRDSRAHHICPKCQQDDKNKNKIKCTCAYCGKEFLRFPKDIAKSKSGLFFCCREHKDLAQRLDSGEEFQQMRPDHYGTGTGEYSYRNRAFHVYEHKCHFCGWDEEEKILEVHHIDQNRQNNNLDNLMILCPNCHAKITRGLYEIKDDKLVKKNSDSN